MNNLRILFLLILSMIAGVASAYDAYVNGIYYNLIPKGKAAEVTLKTQNCYSGTIVIPNSITYNGENYSVISIGDQAFSRCSDLTSVTIPNSVTTIGRGAFEYCQKLTSITIPESVRSIGFGAFSYCDGLKKVIVPNIASWCGISFNQHSSNPLFYAHHIYSDINTEIKELDIPDIVTTIGEYVFYNCEGLTSVSIPGSVASIGENAFAYCHGLTSVSIGNGVTSIGGLAFYDCSKLVSVTIGNHVTSIGDAAFYGCSNLNSVPIPNSVTSIGWEAFQGCSRLTSVTIPNSVTSIGYAAFRYCSRLTSVTISSGVTSIDYWTFANCPELEDVYCLAVNVPTTHSDAFKDSHVQYSTLHVPESSVNSYKAASPWSGFGTITSIEKMPSSGINFADANVKALCVANWDTNGDGELSEDEAAKVTGLGGVFYENKSIISFNELQFFTGLTSIGGFEFHGCENLESIVIPNSVARIDSHAFAHCSSLASIDIPNSVTYLGEAAFEACSGLFTVTIPNSIASIDNYVFKWCSSLNSVSIPSSITSIGYEAFNNCSCLKDVYCYAENVPNTNNDAFDRIYISSATLHVPKGSVESYKSTSPWSGFRKIVPLGEEIGDDNYIDGIYYNFSGNDAEVTYGDIAYSGAVAIPATVTYKGKTYSVTCIGNDAFQNCSNLVSIKIPSTLKRIKTGAFKGCTSLSKIIVTDIVSWCGIVYDGNTASDFPLYYAKRLYSNNNTEITEVVIPESVTRIEALAFRDAKYITSVTIPNNVTYIGREAFRGMHRLTSIIFPQNITSIEPYTCQDCEGLATVIIPKSVTSIGENAFAKCYGLKDVYCYAENVPNTGSNVFKSSSSAFATLHVPEVSLESYKAKYPWSGFGMFLTLEPESRKCATPTISYANGELTFSCETEGAVCQSIITDTDVSSYSSNKVKLSITYHISVYATKEGYDDSDVATATLCWIDVEPATEGIVNEDAVTEMKAMPVLIQTQVGTITIQGAAEGTSIAIYSIDGKQYGSAIAEKDSTTIATSLQPGSVAIVKIGERAVKVLVK